MRFLPDRRLRLEDGTDLDGGPMLPRDEAGRAAKGSHVLLHSYPDVTEMTQDQKTVQRLVDLCRPGLMSASTQPRSMPQGQRRFWS